MIAVLVGAIPAAAATTSAWATWQPLTGTGGAYTTSVQIAAQPAITASVTSDSRAGSVGVISGASTWLSEGTPIGAKYGSSRDQPYLNLRPAADNATSPSTTTYSFAAPTPSSGWAFALGDIDADAVRILATGPNGQVLDAAQIGFQGGFNYCAPGVVGKPSCTGAADDVPTWDPATLTLTGNTTAADTSGAAAWFEPTAPISSLTFSFTQRAGFPVYQTWFASQARDITGSVSDVTDGPLSGVALTLTDANGTEVGSTTTTDGTYSFPGFVATDGYVVTVTPPVGKTTTGPSTVPVDLTDADGVADFTVRDIVPVAVSGQVTDSEGNPIADVEVTVDGQTTVTGPDGGYLFGEVSVGTHTVTVTPPPGYAIITSPPAITVPAGSEDPIENVDFTLARLGSIDGTVRTDIGEPVAGVVIEVTGPDAPQEVTTDADGAFALDDLPQGTYLLTVQPPAGFTVVGDATQTVEITTAGETVREQDFTLAAVVVSPPPVEPVDPTAPAPGGGHGAGQLPTTGLGPETLAWAAGGAVALILGAILVARRRLTRE